MKSLALILLIVNFIFYSTSQSQSNKRNIDLPNDCSLENGFFVKYIQKTDTSYILTWGNKKFQRSMKEMEIQAPNHNPQLVQFNDSVMILEAGCGSECWHGYILPMDTVREVQEISYPVAYDIKNNLVANLELGKDTLATIRNVLTGNEIKILGENCLDVFIGWRIDSISIIDRQFYMRYDVGCIPGIPDEQRQHEEVKLFVSF